MFYTTATLAEFLGWKDWKVEASLAALSLIEEGLATKNQFEGLSSRQAHEIVHQTNRIYDETGDSHGAFDDTSTSGDHLYTRFASKWPSTLIA